MLDDFDDLCQTIEDSKYFIAFIERKFVTTDEKFSDIIKSKNGKIYCQYGEY